MKGKMYELQNTGNKGKGEEVLKIYDGKNRC